MIILDTSFWIALIKQDDKNNQSARSIAKTIPYEDLIILDHVYSETMTVLRNKASEQDCKNFMNFIKDTKIKIILSDEEFFAAATAIFFLNKKLSFTDCLILVSANGMGSELITFDKELEKAWQEPRRP